MFTDKLRRVECASMSIRHLILASGNQTKLQVNICSHRWIWSNRWSTDGSSDCSNATQKNKSITSVLYSHFNWVDTLICSLRSYGSEVLKNCPHCDTKPKTSLFGRDFFKLIFYFYVNLKIMSIKGWADWTECKVNFRNGKTAYRLNETMKMDMKWHRFSSAS